LPWPQLITYLFGGIGAALFPLFPRLELDPGSSSSASCRRCFFRWLAHAAPGISPRQAAHPAARLGLVTFTTLAVGLVAHWLVPGLPLAMAFALGAIVSPTDAVAVNAITERLRVPARLSTILNAKA